MTREGAGGAYTARPTPSGMSPPWLWLWLVLYLVALPGVIATWRSDLADLFGAGDYSADIAASPSFLLLKLLRVVQVLPSLALFAGLLAVALPHARARWVEWRFRLVDDRRRVILEMQRFVDEYAPGVRIRANVTRSGRLARIYPAGWRRARIAVFGPMVKLWARDRDAARAVLLHELAHQRNGDQLIVGLGSPFVALVNAWLPAFVLFALLPVAAFLASGHPAAPMFPAQLGLLLTQIPRLLLLPVAGLWMAELAADRYVVDLGGAAPLRRGLDWSRRVSPRHRFRAALVHLSHPPLRLRRWACRMPARSGDAVALLAAWPLLSVPLLLIVLSSAVPGWRLLGYSWPDTWEEAAVNSRAFLVSQVPAWVAAMLLILGWPALARLWTALWARQRARGPAVPGATYRAAAAVPVVLAATGLVLAGCGSPVPGRASAVAGWSAPTTTTTTTTPPSTSTTTTTTSSTTKPSTTTQRTTTPRVSTPDGGPEPGSYNVTISGAAGGRSFERTGTVRVLGTVASVGTTNGVNPVDVCLVSGFPAAQPEPGAIWYGSNSACVPWASAAHLDLGYVTVDGATVTVEPDARIAATGGNNYTAYGGLAACPYFPVSGRMSVTFRDDGTVTGSIDVVGYGAGCGNTNYQARINGERS